jgi:hypothetical protein
MANNDTKKILKAIVAVNLLGLVAGALLCSAIEAKKLDLFDAPPDPSAVYLGSRNISKSEEVTTLEVDRSKLEEEWKTWHRRLDQAIQEQFKKQADVLFMGGRVLRCTIRYVVTIDKRLRLGYVDAVIAERSGSESFDKTALACVRSVDGTSELDFPAGSTEESTKGMITLTNQGWLKAK